MNTHWLSGGPYFELSLLALNKEPRTLMLPSYIQKLQSIKRSVEFAENKLDMEEKTKAFIQHDSDSIDLNIRIAIAGKRRARFFIAELSSELIMIDFWFLADKFSKHPITIKEKPNFKKLLEELLSVYDGMIGTIAWELDCSCLFKTNQSYPHKDYSKNNLRINKKEIPSGIETLIIREEKFK